MNDAGAKRRPNPRRRPRILVAEDEYLIARHMRTLLRRLGGDVVGPVPNLDRAIELARTERLEAAILDIKLADGRPVYPLADLLAERGVPFLFLSGYSREDIPPRYRKVQLIVKPADLRAFHAAVDALLKARPGRRIRSH
jgi:chemotaxis family two-component system sensor kinase Cph1